MFYAFSKYLKKGKTKMCEFFNSNFFQTLILIITVGVTIIIYYKQRKTETRNAARMIIIQIDSIKTKTNILMRTLGTDTTEFDYEKLWQSENIINNNIWETYRHLFVKKLEYNEIVALNNYYDNVIAIAKQQAEIKSIFSEVNKNYYIKHMEETFDEFKGSKAVQHRCPSLYLKSIQIQYDSILRSFAVVPYDKLKKIAQI